MQLLSLFDAIPRRDRRRSEAGRAAARRHGLYHRGARPVFAKIGGVDHRVVDYTLHACLKTRGDLNANCTLLR